MMQSILITGGTGLVGRALTKQLISKGYKIVILTRSLKNKQNNSSITYAEWDVKKQKIDIEALQSCDHIVHLAGAGVIDKKWTNSYKEEILESRTLSSKLIIDSLKAHPNHVKTFISASATGWYGKDEMPGKFFIESDKASDDFLGQTCLQWEQSVTPAEGLSIRTCRLRTGIVLSNEGGALAEFKKPIRSGIAGILGSGKQMVSWIHIDDLCRMYAYALENEAMAGSYNAVAPVPVTNKKLTVTLARTMRGNFFLPIHVPHFVIKLMLGTRSIEVLKSTTVNCAKIKETGFTFLYPSIEAALQQLSGKKS